MTNELEKIAACDGHGVAHQHDSMRRFRKECVGCLQNMGRVEAAYTLGQQSQKERDAMLLVLEGEHVYAAAIRSQGGQGVIERKP